MQPTTTLCRSLLFAYLVFSLTACSGRAWYESVQQFSKQQCQRQAPNVSEECLRKAQGLDYDTYHKERSQMQPAP